MTMVPLILRRDLGTPTVARNIVLSKVPEPRDTVEVTHLHYYYRWKDDDAMEPQFLGKVAAGQRLSVPFDTKARDIVIMQIGFDAAGNPNATHPNDGEHYIFSQTATPVLSAAAFTGGHAALTIANNGGTGNIRVMRSVHNANAFVEVASVTPATTSHNDTPPFNGDWDYKTIQDGLAGEGNKLTITASGIASPAGSPPDGLTASWDGINTVSLAWTNHGGTGPNAIERETGLGGFIEIGSDVDTSTSFDDTDAAPTRRARTETYRIRNDSTGGYSNEATVTIDGDPDYWETP